MKVEKCSNSHAFKITMNDKYAQYSDSDSALKTACDRLRSVGLQVKNESGNYTISQGDRVLYTATAADWSSYAGISELNELAEAVFFEGYLNANLYRLADLGWRAEQKEVRVTLHTKPANTYLRVTVVSGKSFDYPISLDGAYQLHRDLERAECRRALLRVMPRLEDKFARIVLDEASFTQRRANSFTDYVSGYTFRETNAVLAEVNVSVSVHTFEVPEKWL